MSLQPAIAQSEAILQALIAFDTTSRHSNLELISYVSNLLKQHGIESVLLHNDEKTKANLYASVGPKEPGGVMLSGHTDVVPIDGQDWTYPAFTLTKDKQRLYGRGTADMKGFVACAIAALVKSASQQLKTPLHLALSYDEEIGCVGVHSLLDMLNNAPSRPGMCIVGEPTQLQVATKHKGKLAVLVECRGTEGHSALAPHYQNAIHLACDLVTILRSVQDSIAAAEPTTKLAGKLPDVPYTTVHVGRISTAQALNIVPNLCTVNFEIRHPASDDPLQILEDIKTQAQKLVDKAQFDFPIADIRFTIQGSYPALDTPVDSQVVQFVQSLLNTDQTSFVAFGTEAGLFSSKVGIPTVVCGPGSMNQGHKPDEYLELDQLQQCDHMLDQLIARLIT